MLLRRLILLTSLAAIAISPASAESAWEKYSERWYGTASTDPITDENVLVVRTTTTRVNGRIGFDFARVSLTCNGGKAKLSFEWDFKAAGSAGLVLAFRFAGLPGRDIKVRYVNRSEQETTEKATIRQFLADALRAEGFVVRLQSDLYGLAMAEFRPKAGRDAATKFAAACAEVAPG